jgi:hypothetical protein
MFNKKEYDKKYYQEHKEKILKQVRKYRIINKEKLLNNDKNYYRLNKQIILNKKREYYYNNKEKIIKRITKYCKVKKITDINYRILCNLRNRLYLVLKGINKSKSTMSLVGCSIDKLKHHLQLKFSKGMNWKNYGKWHIDHKKPCASFDLSKPEEQKKCFHYTNLQPLWAKDNLSKVKQKIKK